MRSTTSPFRTPGTWGLGGPTRRHAPSPRDPAGKPIRLAIVRAVWAFVSRHPRASTAEIARGVGLRSVGHAASALRILEGAGYIRRPVTGRGALSRARRIVVPFHEAMP